ncbi:MAG TPA: SpoIIE family protein phosphatase [Candidatus Acidoferrales bacterium]|nr:SpoIIE family protein phosphatase [Candidatus Acidoferrales bacterium]
MHRTPRLILVDPSGARQELAVRKLPFRVGRQAGNELTLRDNRISRQQATIVMEEDRFVLLDVQSRHGTRVNGKEVKRHELKPKDSIDFGVPDSFKIIYAGEEASLEEIIERVETAASADTPSRDLYHLGVLLDVARALHSSLSLEDVLSSVVDAAIRVTRTERGVLMMLSPSGEFVPTAARDSHRTTVEPRSLEVSQSVLRQVTASRRELIVTDMGDETQWQAQASVVRLQIHSVVALPLERMRMADSLDTTSAGQQSELLGVLYLDSHLPAAAFSDLDRAVLRSLAIEASTVIENARLFTAARQMERMNHELEIACDLQQQLLPKSFPKAPHFDVAGWNLACLSVGGDYFDVLELPGKKHVFVVADVAGKGIPAAMLASMLQGIVATAAGFDMAPETVAMHINKYLFERSGIERYATVFLSTLDPEGNFEYVNAGHVPPLVRTSTGQVYPLTSESFPLGMFDFAEFHSSKAKLAPGDIVLIYTDGFTEAANHEGEFFGEPRLRDLLKQDPGANLDELLAKIQAVVREFTQGAPQSDDMTLLVIHYKGAAA